MFVRIVKLTFQEDQISTFLSLFEANRAAIRAAAGCHHLELWRDQSAANVFFTYSLWEDERSLRTYRRSALFRGVWSKVKPLFRAEPEAWSLDQLVKLP